MAFGKHTRSRCLLQGFPFLPLLSSFGDSRAKGAFFGVKLSIWPQWFSHAPLAFEVNRDPKEEEKGRAAGPLFSLLPKDHSSSPSSGPQTHGPLVAGADTNWPPRKRRWDDNLCIAERWHLLSKNDENEFTRQNGGFNEVLQTKKEAPKLNLRFEVTCWSRFSLSLPRGI